MPDKNEFEAEVAAEKAYAAAAEAVIAKPASSPAEAATADTAPEVEFPSKAKRSPKPKIEQTFAVTATPAVSAPAIAPKAALKATTVIRAPKPAPKKLKKVLPVKQAVKPVAKAAPKPTIVAPAITKAAAPKTAAPKNLFQQLKEKTMDTTEFTTKLKGAVTEAQVKAKEAFDKGAATFGEYNEFTKGNVEAVVASGKILATGLQSLGKTFVDDGKNAFETLTAEVKELAAVKSPVDFFKLQAEFLRRNFDIAVANTSKNSEAVLKLASEVAAPISGRVNLAVEKVKKAA